LVGSQGTVNVALPIPVENWPLPSGAYSIVIELLPESSPRFVDRLADSRLKDIIVTPSTTAIPDDTFTTNCPCPDETTTVSPCAVGFDMCDTCENRAKLRELELQVIAELQNQNHQSPSKVTVTGAIPNDLTEVDIVMKTGTGTVFGLYHAIPMNGTFVVRPFASSNFPDILHITLYDPTQGQRKDLSVGECDGVACVRFDTSCSEPILVGNTFGHVAVTGFSNDAGVTETDCFCGRANDQSAEEASAEKVVITNTMPDYETLLSTDKPTFDVDVRYSTALPIGTANLRVFVRLQSTQKIIWYHDTSLDAVVGYKTVHVNNLDLRAYDDRSLDVIAYVGPAADTKFSKRVSKTQMSVTPASSNAAVDSEVCICRNDPSSDESGVDSETNVGLAAASRTTDSMYAYVAMCAIALALLVTVTTFFFLRYKNKSAPLTRAARTSDGTTNLYHSQSGTMVAAGANLSPNMMHWDSFDDSLGESKIHARESK